MENRTIMEIDIRSRLDMYFDDIIHLLLVFALSQHVYPGLIRRFDGRF